jgi:hypothetical protein
LIYPAPGGNNPFSVKDPKNMKRLSGLSAVLKRRTDRHSDQPNHAQGLTDDADSTVDQGSVEAVLGQELGLITRLVGCSHKEMGRPFRDGNIKYRSCMKCGARRQFNEQTFETFGKFYAPPASTKNL